MKNSNWFAHKSEISQVLFLETSVVFHYAEKSAICILPISSCRIFKRHVPHVKNEEDILSIASSRTFFSEMGVVLTVSPWWSTTQQLVELMPLFRIRPKSCHLCPAIQMLIRQKCKRHISCIKNILVAKHLCFIVKIILTS